MNPSGNEAASGQATSPPAMERIPLPKTGLPEIPTDSPERAPAAPERVAVSPPSPGPAAPPLLPTLTLPTPPPTADPRATTAATTPSASLQVTDDGDLIEKEWVTKAKQIVEKTRDDPYKQSEELTLFKADYLQKRYGKTIKLSQ